MGSEQPQSHLDPEKQPFMQDHQLPSSSPSSSSCSPRHAPPNDLARTLILLFSAAGLLITMLSWTLLLLSSTGIITRPVLLSSTKIITPVRNGWNGGSGEREAIIAASREITEKESESWAKGGLEAAWRGGWV